MTKLVGTSGQLFAGLAESLATGKMVRFGKGAGGKTVDHSFRDLLHTVSNRATQAADEQASEGNMKAGTLRRRLAQSAEPDETKDDAVHERTESTEDSKSSSKQSQLDLAPKAELQSRLSLPTTAGQELAAVQAMKPQAQPFAGDRKDAPARSERSTRAPELPGVSAAKAITADLAEPMARPSAATPPAPTPQVAKARAAATTQAGATQAGATQQGAALPKSASAAPGFEAVTANIDHAVKLASREALPEATKVTVVQQETHLPPVAQFTAPQQVAKAVVAELAGAAAPTSAAAPDAAPSQGNAPDQPLKVLTINLEPPALGNVTVRLRLVGEAVSVHLAADRKDTSQMLDQQRDSIRELMQSAGYVAEVAPVRHGTLDGFQPGAGQSQASLSGQQQAPSGQGAADNSSASSGQPQGGAKQARDERAPNQETRHEPNVAAHARRGPVYL
jgi:chemotaxis protein MotD